MVDKVSKANVVRKLTAPDMVVQLISEDRARLKLEDVNKLLHLLGERKRLLQQQDAESNLQLLLQFLRHSRYIHAGPQHYIYCVCPCQDIVQDSHSMPGHH